ncbi:MULTISPECIES: aspartate aminotransferase family protein [Amycolatopsis]|uniref:Aspartate aminotransferase family protein n=1 Tax=Amycolatopsis thermalba TaxID=944492 RepID=A0ABY4NNE4_9PSEU|nr:MULTISPECIES: aspartate aminotransferase family protein [Amycolatopsis]OXM74160.1 aspartate aminotransferase family protein [Amycolatopsis sp. KNN50.9b]UQS22113.1 aspartate aminotransferase family protein [Amycolatopsis thermalba]
MPNDSTRLGPRSAELRRRAAARTPGGVHSNVRLTGAQEFIERAKGAWLYSVDGRDYVDYLLGQGPNFLGHAPDHVVDAVSDACRRGVIFGGQHELEVQASELVCRAVGWADMIRFGVSGTEVVQGALRLARAATGRTKVIRFEGHYHGWLDNVLTAARDGHWGVATKGQVARHLDDFIVLPWNDAEQVADALDRHGEQVAAVIMEPVMINAGVIEPLPGYLEAVRRLCDRHGVVLIFDEVISGFRLGLGGGAERYGVPPDLATYGKAIAGGFPVAALVGRAELMSRFGTGEVNHSGTFNGSVMATAAVAATVTSLLEDPPYERVAKHGRTLMVGLRDLGIEHGLPLRVEGLPAAFHVSFGDAEVRDYRTLQRLDLARYERLSRVLVEHGLWVTGRGVWYVSACHGEEELDAALTRFEKALRDGAGR